MDNNLDKIALDLYGKIETRFPDIRMGNENAEVLSKKVDIPKARFFEFEYTEDGEELGTITITLDSDDGIVVQISGDLVNDNDDEDATDHKAYDFIKSFRKFAKSRLLNFDVQNIEKNNLDTRDYEFQAKPKEQQMMESKMFGTSRLSYQNLGDARLVIKHTQPINPELAAGRTMHIGSIYIENADGERFKYPFKHLNGARALAEHIKHGGNPYDDIGKHITKLSEELNTLRKFKGYVTRQNQLSEAMGEVTSQVVNRIDSIKKEIQQLQRPAFYEEFAESFVAHEERIIPETVMNDWIDRLTIRTFNEDMKAVFPFLYNIVDESTLPIRELSVNDFLGVQESIKAPKYKSTPKHIDDEYAFESFINRIMNEEKDELFGPNKEVAIKKFNELLKSEIRGGPDGVNAINTLKPFIDDENFDNMLSGIHPDLDVRALVQQYVKERNAKVAAELEFGNNEFGGEGDITAPPPAPEPMPAPADAGAAPLPGGGLPPIGGGGALPPIGGGLPPEGELPPESEPGTEAPPAPGTEAPPAPGAEAPPAEPPAPVQEGMHHKTARIKAKFIKAKKAGATLETMFADGMTILDAIRECGLSPRECGYTEYNDEEDENDGGEPEVENLSGKQQILNSIAGFWNDEENNFTIGGTRVKIKIVKGFEDGEFSNASDDDVRSVLKLVNKLDPSEESQEQDDVLRLAGVQHDDGDHDIDSMMKELHNFKYRRDSIDKYRLKKHSRNNHERNFRSRTARHR